MGFYIVALALAPLSLVQAVSAGGIGILAALAHRRGELVTRRHWAAVALSGSGLLLLGVSLAGGTVTASPPGIGALAAWLTVSGAVAALMTLGGARLAAGAGLGVAAGTLYAAGDVATKAATFTGGWLVLVPLVLLAHSAAFIALQFGFQRGGALATAGTTTLLTNSLPIVSGILLFHEGLPGGTLGLVRLVAFASTVIGAAALVRDDPERLDSQAPLKETERTARVEPRPRPSARAVAAMAHALAKERTTS